MVAVTDPTTVWTVESSRIVVSGDREVCSREVVASANIRDVALVVTRHVLPSHGYLFTQLRTYTVGPIISGGGGR